MGLYEGGINRSVFVPLVDVLMERLMIVEMKEKRIDYIKEKAKGLMLEEKESLLLMDSDNHNDDVVAPSLPSYLVTSNSNDLNDVVVKEVLNKWFSKGSGSAPDEQSMLLEPMILVHGLLFKSYVINLLVQPITLPLRNVLTW
jgi:predicted ATPase